ncbi:PP2C family serine/threonine-protein phosphatase [Pseudomonas wenzhouensis]|nr:PP2C family serine/threonine-protein phosphatase [Pseudomonas wenzhouensis]MDM9652073.1 PP2C family serine/threonine-protein phosphatase [Pseudomonas wenzhouensis]
MPDKRNKPQTRRKRSKAADADALPVMTAIVSVAPENTSSPDAENSHADLSTCIETAAATEAAPQPSPKASTSLPNWRAMHEAVVGLSHRNANPPLPCQDAALAATLPRPVVLIADGAGSSAVSEIGAQTAVTALARLLNTLDRQLAGLLDEPADSQDCAGPSQQARHFALLLVKHARGVLEDLAAQHRRPLRDFRCTLLLLVVGETHALWLKLGDGALVCERVITQPDGEARTELCTLGETGKGEYANTTQFIDEHLRPEHVQSGLLPLAGVTGLAAMSDGAAEKLIAQDGSRVAAQLQHWLQALRLGQLPRRVLTRSFYSEAFCQGSSGDDCSIALLALDPAVASQPTQGKQHG